ncbi:hypothetical protein [Thiothrix subterranea]|uniref:Uncharacterized protein n=1 Tax=Thiothrix subterranea TaxID=2735563 RepID=A0AA51R508_9GAMM|nr:hypothetical protein [Thiothrix subterranea]MDQ5770822.1 hypothetical protein [Thiothrix subterranea]WML87260.1 hypothetical protein RCG00_02615 [Thiothrix subterranea]
MNLSNAYLLSQDLSESAKKLQAHQHDLQGIKTSQAVFTLATYFIYFSFTAVIFAGVTVWKLQSYIFDNYTNVIGMVWALVTVFAVPLALSLAKHFNYKAIAKNSVERGHRGQLIIHAIIALALISGLYYEAISSSSNLQAKAFHSVENSKAGEAILNTTVNNSSSGAIAGLIADAEYKLVSCKRLLAEGKTKDCNNSQAKVDSLKSQAQAERESVASANVAAISAKQTALDKERDSHALPAAKYAAEITNMSNDAGTMIIVIIAALFFELIHITTIFNEARALRGLDTYSASLKMLNGEYFKATGKTFDSGDFKDNRTIDLSDKPLNVPVDEHGADFEVKTKGQPYKDNKTGFGFVPQTAKLFKWQDEPNLPAKPEKQGFGFIQSGQVAKDRETSLLEENRRKYAQEIILPTNPRPTPSDYAPVARKESVHASTEKPLHERVGDSKPLHERVDTRINEAAYTQAAEAKAGTYVDCPQCGANFRKANKWHTFCKSTCKDDWHNAKDPTRLEALKAKSRRRKA